MFMSQALFSARQSLRNFTPPLRHRQTQAANRAHKTPCRYRSIYIDDHINQRVDPRIAHSFINQHRVDDRRVMLVRRIESDPCLAPHDPQQSLIVHVIEQVSRRVRRPSPIVLNAAVSKMLIDLARMHHAALAHKLQQQHGPLFARGRGCAKPFAKIQTRMHQRLHLARHKSVINEKIFLDPELRVAAVQVAVAIVFHPMAQNQILRPRGSANRISLHKSHLVKRAPQRRRREQTAPRGIAPQIIQANRHEPWYRSLKDRSCPRRRKR